MLLILLIRYETYSMKILYKSWRNTVKKTEKLFVKLKLWKFWSWMLHDFVFDFFCGKTDSILFKVFLQVNSFVGNLGLKVFKSKGFFSVKGKDFFVAWVKVIVHCILELLIGYKALYLFFFEFLILKFFLDDFFYDIRYLIVL